MSELVTFNCQVETIQSRKDNTLKVVLGTQELNEGGKLFPLQNKLCTIGIVPNEALTQADIEIIQSSNISLEDVPNGKTPSQRLRGALYVYFTQNETGYDDFNLFYANWMEKRIENVKSKLQ